MLTYNDEIMLEKIRMILDEIHQDQSKISGVKRKADGTLTLYVEYGSSTRRFNPPQIRVEIISYTLAGDVREKLFIFDSIQDAYSQVQNWYDERKRELKTLSESDRSVLAKKVSSQGSSAEPIISTIE